MAALAAILVAGFAAVNLANYYLSGHAVRQALINNELPLTSDNIYSEIQASLLRPIYISSLMANDTFLKDWMLDGEEDVGRVTRYLREIKDQYDAFSTFVVSDITQRYYHYNGILKSVSPEVPKDAWFFSMRDHAQNYRVDVDFNEASRDRLTIFINHKLHDYDGRFIGVTGIGLDAAGVSQLIQRYVEVYRRNIYFVDRAGTVKSHHDDGIIDKVGIREKPGISSVADSLLSNESGSLEYALDGDTMLLTYRFVPELDWYLIVEQPESEALQPIRQAFYVNSAISLAITLLVLVVSGYTVGAFQRRLESMAKTDKLTGVINRQYFDAILERALKGIARTGGTMSLIVFDVDTFKAVNDRYGHLAGDAVLARVAEIASEVIRKSDVLCRWGGDEFIVLLFDCDEQAARRVADTLRKRVREAVCAASGCETPITISAGVAQCQPHDTYETALGRADESLYRAKREGRDRTCAAQASDASRGPDTAPAQHRLPEEAKQLREETEQP